MPIRYCLDKLDTAFNTKIKETEDDIHNHNKYITTQKFNKLTEDSKVKTSKFSKQK